MANKIYRSEIAMRRRRYRAAYIVTLILLSAAALLVAALLILFKTPLFQVRSVSIQGTGYIPGERVEALLQGRVTGGSWLRNFLGYNNMLVWPAAVNAADLRYLPEARRITIAKSYAHRTITVNVEERGREGIWCFIKEPPPQCFWFDALGIVNKAPSTEGSLILAVQDYSRSSTPRGEALLPPEMLANLFSVFAALKEIPVAPKEIRLNDLDLKEVQVPTYDGPTLEFSLQFPAVNTPAAFKKLAARTPISKLEYIDFRVENRIYYK